VPDLEKKGTNSISRREFLKSAGIVIGGAALASLALSSACKHIEPSADTPPSTSPPAGATTGTTATATTPASPVSISALPSTTPPVSSSTTTATGTTKPITTATTSAPAPTLNSNLIDIPGCDTKVAVDRLYSLDHVWVKTLNNNIVQVGMSDQFQKLADKVRTCYISPSGTNLVKDAAFGYIEADKLSVDLIAPVSGKVVDNNISLMSIPDPINADPYGAGWMQTIQMSKPAELGNLVSARYYAYLQSGTNWTGPVPAMH